VSASDAALLLEREAIRELIQRSGALLDQERFDEWLALFAPDAVYEVVTDSPELGGPSAWVNRDRAGIARYLAEMPERVRYRDRRRHLIGTVALEIAGDSATACSHLAVFRTGPDGVTTCEVAGRYDDTFVRVAGEWRVLRRRVELDTRVHAGNHVPL
jgi:anthranilate 1,2-dioxygenase small subunit